MFDTWLITKLLANHWTEVDWTGVDSSQCQKYHQKQIYHTKTDYNGLCRVCKSPSCMHFAVSMGVWNYERCNCQMSVWSHLCLHSSVLPLFSTPAQLPSLAVCVWGELGNETTSVDRCIAFHLKFCLQTVQVTIGYISCMHTKRLA